MPCGSRRSRTMAAASSATSPSTGVVAKVRELLMVPNSAGRPTACRPGSRAAADHRDEGLGDVGGAHGRHDAGQRCHQAAGQARQGRAEREGDGIDPRRVDAQGRGHARRSAWCRGRSGRAGSSAGSAKRRAKQDYRDSDQEQLVAADADRRRSAKLPSGAEKPAMVLPNTMVTQPISSRLRPQVASMVSTMRP